MYLQVKSRADRWLAMALDSGDEKWELEIWRDIQDNWWLTSELSGVTQVQDYMRNWERIQHMVSAYQIWMGFFSRTIGWIPDGLPVVETAATKMSRLTTLSRKTQVYVITTNSSFAKVAPVQVPRQKLFSLIHLLCGMRTCNLTHPFKMRFFKIRSTWVPSNGPAI